MAPTSGKALESPSLSTPRRMFSLRIVNLDYYMAPPLPGMDVCYSEFQGRGVREVPVVRIFGSTLSGQKTCLHLHKAFPYFYVPYDSELPQEVNEALAFVRRLASSMEKAMKISSAVGAKRQHLHSCSLVRGKKFYGYHPNEQLFIKIVLYYPQEVSRVSTLLLSGGIMSHKFQPHEAHFPYLLQILIDHNLCGMGHLHLSSLKFRNPLPEAPTDLASMVKRVKRDFSYQEAIPRIEAAVVDPTKDYSSLKEGLLKEKAILTLPLSPQPMKGDTVSSLPASRSSSPSINLVTIKEETLGKLPSSKSSSPAIYQTTIKEETLSLLPASKSSFPALCLTTIKEETLSTLPAFKPSSPAIHLTTIKEDRLSTLPGSKQSSPAVHQTTPEGGSQPEIWLQKSVPGDWIWPLIASDNMETAIQGQGLYSRQSTCELEADASVEDILNRGELLFLPLQQAGPEIKMVQSLTPMWEEERARSGEDGPAGLVDPLYQSTARTVPIPSPFEQAMRETLFQIARAEDLELGSRSGSQSGPQNSVSGSGTQSVLEICTLLGSQQELKVSLGSTGSDAPASDEDEPLLVQGELDPKTSSDSRLESPLISPHGEIPSSTDAYLRNLEAAKDGGSFAINEELIRKQLSQRCMSQDLDKEVAEFLRWMGTTQLDSNDQEDEHPDDKDGEMAQMALTQMFSSPGMDAALLKALADYENATEQECQAILECADLMDEEEQDVADMYEGAQLKAEEGEKAFTALTDKYDSYNSRRENDWRDAPPYIPQTDGAGDEDELEDERDRSLQSFSSKRPRNDRQDASWSTHKHVSFGSGLQGLSKEQRSGVSLRDMMRKRRERKPGRKELCSPSSSILEAVSSEVEPDFSKDNAGSLPSSDEKHQRIRGRNVLQDQSVKVSLMEDSTQSEDLLETTTRVTSLDRNSAYRKKGKIIQKSENRNQVLTSRYGTLPIVTLKYDSADVNCRVEHSEEKVSEGCRASSREDQGIAEHKSTLELLPECSSQKSLRQTSVLKEVVVGEDITGIQSRGDDRDCGGGHTFLEQCPDSVFKGNIDDPRQGTGSELVAVLPREPEHLTEYLSEADLSDDDDYFVAQTQFPSTTIPQSSQTVQLHTEGLHVDVEDDGNVDISSQDGEDLMLSQAPVLAVSQLTTINENECHENRERRRLLDKAYEDSDCVRQTQVVKPDVSYMIAAEFECRDHVGGLQIPDKDVVSVEHTHSLNPFIPFLDSRDPRNSHDQIAEIEELRREDEGDEPAWQTQILERENSDVSDVPKRMSTEFVRIESDVPDLDGEDVDQTQVLYFEGPHIDDPHTWEAGALLEEGIERDMADEDAAFVRPTHELEYRSLRVPELSPRESCGRPEGMHGVGDLYKRTRTLKLEKPYANEYHSVDTGEFVEGLRGGNTLEEGVDSDAQTQILTPEEVRPSTHDIRTAVEVSTSRSLGDFLNLQIPKIVKAELVYNLSSGLPVGVTENPQETDLHPFFHGERLDGGVGGAGIPAEGIKTLDGPNHKGSHPTQYLFCDMSDDSEASYDSEQDMWCRDEGASTAALFEEKDIGELGNPASADDYVEEMGVTMGRETGWGDATALSPPICEVEKKDQDIEEMGGPSTVHGDVAQLGGPNSVRMHSTQYLFTDMSDDSEASYDSGRDGRGRDSSWNAAEELFAEEEKEGESLFLGEEGQPSGWQTGGQSGLGVLGDEEHRGMSEEQNRHDITIHKPLPTDVLVGKEGQDYDFVMAENFDRKDRREYPTTSLSPFKISNPLESGDMKTSIITSGIFDPSSGKSLLALPASASESPHSCSGNASAITKFEVCHDSEEDVVPSAVSCLKTVEEEDGKVIMEENDLHVPTESPLDLGKVGVIKDATDMQLEAQSYPTHVLSKVHSSWKLALVPFAKNHADQQLMPLIFRQRPPTREQILESSKEIICHYKEDDVFYGNLKDVSDHPVVRAGLVFDVRSREAVHLRPFQFGKSSRRSNFDQGSKHRVYIQQETWGCEEKSDFITGIPTYIENDGTCLYLISPAKVPPTPSAVKHWLCLESVRRVETSKGRAGGGQQLFTMDANTGQLLPLVEIGSAANSQESIPKTESSQENGELVRPASPKYDERHVFYLTHSSSTTPSSHDFSQRRPSASKYGDQSVNISSVNVPLEQGKKSSHGLPPLAPCTAQTSGPQSPSLADKTTSREVLLKKISSSKPIDSGIKALVNRKLSENGTTKTGRQWRDISQMTGFSPAETPLSQSGFRDPASSGLGQQIILMSIEVFSETRGELLPDPCYDAIGCIVIVLQEDGGRAGNTNTTVVLIRDTEAHSTRRYPDGIHGCELIYLPDEVSLFKCFAHLVRLCDPDMLVGWEVQGFSLGLLAERAANLGISLLKQLSRIPPVSTASSYLFNKEVGGEDQGEAAALFDRVSVETIGVDEPIIDDEWGRTHGSGLYIGGRTVLNAWRIMRGEVKLNIYSIEAVAEAVLRRKVPRLPWQTLTRCFMRGPCGGRHHCIEYFVDRARLTLEIMEKLDLMNRTAELARVFGIDFYSVFSRGSQFRVESMMARLAHTQNYLLVSPTRQQVAEQPGMQCLPLVMEPESRFYNSPVIVLDFQSLYPSMIIAYNLCFSTCLGKLSAENPKVLGVTKLKLDQGILSGLKDSMTITPNGIMYAPKEVLPGVLPRLLQEILSTRIMVKKAMKKLSPDQRVLERVLNARQFALKLIANVTYGYTAAGFSGRMPCAEIADSIVQCGRLTLERAINMVNTHPLWNARVVYGDTDSMFVLCEGRTKEEAFKIGEEIVASVTETNPPPVTLKLEKVYLPCVLLTKKRYVGYSFESPSQVKPIFDSKGIETIRRDTCPAVAKAVEHSLRILFETQDLSQVKQYLQRQWGKILSGRISVQDFVFAKEVRLGTYSARSPVLPPAAIVASKAMAVDPRAEPRYAERIPYVVVHGEPGARLVDMVVDPLTLISQPSLRLHDTYYITKQIIPACQRIFMLVGVDLRAWFSEMPRVYRPPTSKRVSNLVMGAKSTRWDPDAGKLKKTQGLRHGTIDQYFLSRHCTICGEFTRASQLMCSKCFANPTAAAIILPGRTARLEKEYKHLEAICRHCGGGDGSPEGTIACISLDCSVFFERRKVHRELIAGGAVSNDLGYYPPCLPELF